MQRLRNICFVWLILAASAPILARGADILTEVPNDALGFVLVHNFTAVDAKVGRLATTLQRNLPRPLSFLQAVTGISDGLNADGDFLLVLFPEAGDGQLQFCVWLPIADYDRFTKSIGAASIEGIAAATIAGEDLLVARRGDWALVMDPDQRDRLADLAAATPSPPPMPAWKPWINSNDVTVVAFAPGLQQIFAWLDEDGDAGDKVDDNPFGSLNVNRSEQALVATNANRGSADALSSVKGEFQKWAAATPELTPALQQVSVAACGLRLDDNGNALAGLRVAINKQFTDELKNAEGAGRHELPFSAYAGGGFALCGAGRLPPSLLATIAAAYVRRTAADLTTEERTELDEASLEQLQDAVEQASADVHSVAVLSQPGPDSQPVYTNDFVALRVASASAFVGHANDVMRLWNKTNRDANGETRLVFDVEEIKVGDRMATQYALDVAALDGAVVVPEVRQAMEKLFGAGGKLCVWIVPTDDHTVLLAAATPEQVASAVKLLDRKQPVDWKGGEKSECNALLPAESDWRMFIDPHRYNDWLRREAADMVGVPVIGGPLVLEFPASPPVGIAGGIREGELWLDAAALAPTIKSAGAYLARSRARNSLQQRARILAPAPPPAPMPK